MEDDRDINLFVDVEDVNEMVAAELKKQPEATIRLTKCVLYWYGAVMAVGDAPFTVKLLKDTFEYLKPTVSDMLSGADPYTAGIASSHLQFMETVIDDLIRLAGKSGENDLS